MSRYRLKFLMCLMFVFLAVPSFVLAGGAGATNLVVVADTRRVSGAFRFIANLYNTDPLMFAVCVTVLTALWGGLLGLTMDKLIGLSGLNLKSRKLVEH